MFTDFLNGDMEENICIEQPEGSIESFKPNYVCKFLKASYGIKQASRQWNKRIEKLLINELGFNTSRSDAFLHTNISEIYCMLIALYEGGFSLSGDDLNAVTWVKSELYKRFQMRDLIVAKKCIGLEINRLRVSRQTCTP